ncbi:hypothetical protein BH09PAT2_BH09PAT2_07840 [soil metagenome]
MSPDEYSPVKKTHNKKRIIAIALVTLVGLPMLFFGLMAGQNIFAREEDQIPHDVVISNVTKSSATISWITDRNTQGVIEYGVSPNVLNFYAPEQTPRKEHKVDLTLLTSSTPYYLSIRIADKPYDNAGMPWTFTTKSETGEDVTEQVRGITTRISSAELKKSKTTITPTVCTAKTCAEIQLQLGHGCAMTDYIKMKCMGTSSNTQTSQYTLPTPTASVLGTSTSLRSPTPTTYSTSTSTVTPLPTTVLIRSYSCNLDFLQADTNSANKCNRWTWDSMNTKTELCRKSFGRYILECKDRSFDSAGQETWYFKDAIEQISSTSASLTVVPPLGTNIYCRIRAEDKVGGDDNHATNWVNAIKKCE